MGKTIIVIIAGLVATAAWGYIHMDDFQSYDDGEDLATYADWENFFGWPSNVCCVDLGGDEKAACFVPNDYIMWCYLWVPTADDELLDYGISFDFMYNEETGATASVSTSIRCIYTEAYFVGIRPATGYLKIQYWDGTLNYVRWEHYLDESLAYDEWHNLEYYVYGENPVQFDVFVNGEHLGTYVEEEYILPEGHSSLMAEFIMDPDEIYVDNIKQLEYAVGVSPVSLGQLKAVFH